MIHMNDDIITPNHSIPYGGCFPLNPGTLLTHYYYYYF